MVDGLDDFFLYEAAKDLGTLLLARTAWTLFLAGIGNEHLLAAVVALEPGETCMQTTTRQECIEASPGSAGQQTMLRQEPLVVGVEEQVEVLRHGSIEIGRFGSTPGVNTRCGA